MILQLEVFLVLLLKKLKAVILVVKICSLVGRHISHEHTASSVKCVRSVCWLALSHIEIHDQYFYCILDMYMF
jgi:hypothetical protein